MTFKILNDEAREQIAAHIFGAAPPGHPRAGSVSGTDAPAKSYEPPPFKYGGTHTYLTGGSGPTGSQGQGGQANMCVADRRTGFAQPVAPNHDGKCPPDTGTITYQLLNAGTPNAVCCPSFNEAAAQGGPGGSPGGVRPPTGQPPVVNCPSEMQQGSPLGTVAIFSTGFAQYKYECSNNGGTLTESQSSPGYFVCCRPETPSEPPSGTGTGTGEVKEDDDYPTAFDGICSVATPVADIASKSWGWAKINISTRRLTKRGETRDCTDEQDGEFLGSTYSSDLSCEALAGDPIETVYAYNPGGTTIARNTQVVVVRTDATDSYMTRAIIVVVPCT